MMATSLGFTVETTNKDGYHKLELFTSHFHHSQELLTQHGEQMKEAHEKLYFNIQNIRFLKEKI